MDRRLLILHQFHKISSTMDLDRSTMHLHRLTLFLLLLFGCIASGLCDEVDSNTVFTDTPTIKCSALDDQYWNVKEGQCETCKGCRVNKARNYSEPFQGTKGEHGDESCLPCRKAPPNYYIHSVGSRSQHVLCTNCSYRYRQVASPCIDGHDATCGSCLIGYDDIFGNPEQSCQIESDPGEYDQTDDHGPSNVHDNRHNVLSTKAPMVPGPNGISIRGSSTQPVVNETRTGTGQIHNHPQTVSTFLTLYVAFAGIVCSMLVFGILFTKKRVCRKRIDTEFASGSEVPSSEESLLDKDGPTYTSSGNRRQSYIAICTYETDDSTSIEMPVSSNAGTSNDTDCPPSIVSETPAIPPAAGKLDDVKQKAEALPPRDQTLQENMPSRMREGHAAHRDHASIASSRGSASPLLHSAVNIPTPSHPTSSVAHPSRRSHSDRCQSSTTQPDTTSRPCNASYRSTNPPRRSHSDTGDFRTIARTGSGADILASPPPSAVYTGDIQPVLPLAQGIKPLSQVPVPNATYIPPVSPGAATAHARGETTASPNPRPELSVEPQSESIGPEAIHQQDAQVQNRTYWKNSKCTCLEQPEAPCKCPPTDSANFNNIIFQHNKEMQAIFDNVAENICHNPEMLFEQLLSDQHYHQLASDREIDCERISAKTFYYKCLVRWMEVNYGHADLKTLMTALCVAKLHHVNDIIWNLPSAT